MKRLLALLLLAATPARADWDDVHVMLYPERTPAALAALPALGIDGVKIFGFRTDFTQADVDARIAAPAAAGMRWWVENIATDYYAPYHRWTPEHPQDVNWEFLRLQARHQQNPADASVFRRAPALWDPAWRARITARLAATVRAHQAHRPLYYDLADEPGIADLSAAWDFDQAPESLALFRAWLRRLYPSLAALNAEWNSDFPSWDAVLPQGTTEAMARGDNDFAAWNDFKQFMDEQFAEALRAGTDALHAADPTAIAAIEGAQMPGWGGWNDITLAHAVDAMEIYDSGHNQDILRSLNPSLVAITTTGVASPQERRRLWAELLRGTTGFVIWDEDNATVRPDGTPGPSGAAMAPFWRELRGGLGALLLASPETPGPAAILYAPAAFRLQWLQDHRAQGDAWTRRSAERENDPNAVRAAMDRAAAALARNGLPPRWLAAGTLAQTLAAPDAPRALILPRVLALSDADAAAIAAFAQAGGRVLADGPIAVTDDHLKPRPTPALAGTTTPLTDAALADLPTPLAQTAPPTAPPTLTLRHNGAITILAIQPAETTPRPTSITLAHPPAGTWRDLRAGGPWHAPATGPLTIKLDPEAPALLAFSPTIPPDPTLSLAATATTALPVTLTPPATSPATATIIHLAFTDPTGHPHPLLATTLRALKTPVATNIPFPKDAPPGRWTLTATNPLTGTTTRHDFELRAGR